MPKRNTVFASNETYHIFNRAVHRAKIFSSDSLCFHAKKRLWFYHFENLHINYTRYSQLKSDFLVETHRVISLLPKAVRIHAYCLMPNHYHLLVTQLSENGINKFISKFQSSYAQFYNRRNKVKGSLFESRFKAVSIEDDNQFLHVSRYIHLNPFTSFVVKDLPSLNEFKWSSLSMFSNPKSDPYSFTDISETIALIGSAKKYLEFVYDQSNYQRYIHQIKHLTFD